MATSRSEYAPSLLQEDTSYCYVCGRRDRKLDRHEIFPGPYRQKSKEYGLWVCLCHEDCHEVKRGVHANRELRERLSAEAQEAAMEAYSWSVDDFRTVFGKDWRCRTE